ncbi:hypothetical protein BB561_002888 [Smittium simulii]|uniref:Uncharacterized protein n=1 Tax=Smittium simulii TaxID=133385 RepID=A0A2T9YNW7_9FUNG|nr:hypothetical protein BB561_002888 [Smittium simulii]
MFFLQTSLGYTKTLCPRSKVARPLFSKFFYSTEVASNNNKPLSGIRVLDLSRILAGPYCTMLLGDLGAEVLKIEHPERGDDTRTWGPPYAPYKVDVSKSASKHNKLKHVEHHHGESAYYLCVNRNKKSVTVNIKNKTGVEIIKQLAAKSDIIIENYVPGKLAEMGLGYEDLRAINDKLIYASITGYGSTGPFASKPGYDVMIEAEAGLMHITGEKTGNPVKVGVAITDVSTGLYAHGAIMAALLNRQRTGKGQHLDISLLSTQLSTLVNIGSNYLIGKKEASRWGSEHASIVPYRNYNTKTDPICIGGGNDKQFQILAKCLNLEYLLSDKKYESNSARVKHRQELDGIIQERLYGMTRDQVLEALNNKGVPIAPINNMEKTFSHPQVVAKNMVTEINHPAVGPTKLVSPAVGYSDTPLSIEMPPPMLGQHTRSVLSSVLGYSQDDIVTLCTQGAISVFDYNF